MPDADTLLAAYDDQMRQAEVSHLPPGIRAEPDGPIVRVVGHHRGFISAPQELHAGVRSDPPTTVVFIAEAAGEVVSAAWLVLCPGTEFAGLWGGSTLAEWRGLGIYRALVARRAQHAVAHGVRYLQVDASDPGDLRSEVDHYRADGGRHPRPLAQASVASLARPPPPTSASAARRLVASMDPVGTSASTG